MKNFKTVKTSLQGRSDKQEIIEVVKELQSDKTIDQAYIFYLGGNHLSVLDKQLRKEVLFILLK